MSKIQPPRYLKPMNKFMTISLFVLGAAQVILVLNFFLSMRRGKIAGPNPWRANTLEWQTSSPPPHHNFDHNPTVYRGPYEYSAPERADDHWPQDEPPGRETPPPPKKTDTLDDILGHTSIGIGVGGGRGHRDHRDHDHSDHPPATDAPTPPN